jgi:hypothetical protein
MLVQSSRYDILNTATMNVLSHETEDFMVWWISTLIGNGSSISKTTLHHITQNHKIHSTECASLWAVYTTFM